MPFGLRLFSKLAGTFQSPACQILARARGLSCHPLTASLPYLLIASPPHCLTSSLPHLPTHSSNLPRPYSFNLGFLQRWVAFFLPNKKWTNWGGDKTHTQTQVWNS